MEAEGVLLGHGDESDDGASPSPSGVGGSLSALEERPLSSGEDGSE